jgi:hypothetical protein
MSAPTRHHLCHLAPQAANAQQVATAIIVPLQLLQRSCCCCCCCLSCLPHPKTAVAQMIPHAAHVARSHYTSNVDLLALPLPLAATNMSAAAIIHKGPLCMPPNTSSGECTEGPAGGSCPLFAAAAAAVIQIYGAHMIRQTHEHIRHVTCPMLACWLLLCYRLPPTCQP